MTRGKQNSSKRSTIVDLSWPKGASVNSAIPKNKYLTTYFTLHYPFVDHITQTLRKLGPRTLFYKIDISRAFKHLCIDLGEKKTCWAFAIIAYFSIDFCHLDFVTDPDFWSIAQTPLGIL